MKGNTSREGDSVESDGTEKKPPEPTYHVHYPVAYDIGAPYTVIV